MSSDTQATSTPKWMLWTGRVLTILMGLALLASGIVKLVMPPFTPEGSPDIGWDASLVPILGIVELVCAIIYLFPRTAVFGAILLTGYLGGAVATHVRVHDHFFAPIILGVLLWLGLYLREARLRAIAFWRN